MISFADVYKHKDYAIDLLYDLMLDRCRNQDVNISAILPTRKEHRKFFLSKPYRFWFLVMVDERVIGAMNATDRNEIGIFLFKEFQEKGYGTDAVKLFMEIKKPLDAIPSYRPGKWMANINPANAASIRMFEKLGFEHIQNTYLRSTS